MIYENQVYAWFPLVLRIIRMRDFYDFLASEILMTSGNTPISQTFQTVHDFYDMIRRIKSISTLKVHPKWPPTSAIFTMSVNMKFACLGWRLGDTCYVGVSGNVPFSWVYFCSKILEQDISFEEKF